MLELIKNREPMGKVIFKDGHEESIVFYRMFNANYVEFFTESSAYSYEPCLGELKFYEHIIGVYDDQLDDVWIGANEIEKIELY